MIVLELFNIEFIITLASLISAIYLINKKINGLVNHFSNILANNVELDRLSNDSDVKKLLDKYYKRIHEINRNYTTNKSKIERLELQYCKLEILNLMSLKANNMYILEIYNKYKGLGGNSYIDKVVNDYINGVNSFKDVQKKGVL